MSIPSAGESLAEIFARLPDVKRQRLLKGLSEQECASLLYDWHFWARSSQLPPEGDWFCWLILAGRGFGKTRTAVEWVRSQVEGKSPSVAPENAPERVALIADTFVDGRQTMIEGESGILACSPPDFRPTYESSTRRLVWPNGIQAFLYSSESPDHLRGPQHHLAWADEIAKWNNLEETWSNLVFGLRLGENPRILATTTPRNRPFLKDLLKDERVIVTRGSTLDNQAHLPESFLDEIAHRYQGTRLGRQEIEGELLSDTPGALWTQDMLESARCKSPPDMKRIVVAIDPPVSSGKKADTCGIIVAGLDHKGHGYVLADRSVQGLSPLAWANVAIQAYHEFAADRMIAEVNNGGELVENLIRQVDPSVSYRPVHARRGKSVRAEPVAALFEQKRVFLAGSFRELEDELCLMTATGFQGDHSPDRLDAMVWALTELMLSNLTHPQVRNF